MADTTKPPRRPFGPALFAESVPVDLSGCDFMAPEDSLAFMNWELGVLEEAESHYRARGNHATAASMKRGIEELELRIAAKQAGIDPLSPEARARVRWKIPARKRVVY
jgi:hypothetical protein